MPLDPSTSQLHTSVHAQRRILRETLLQCLFVMTTPPDMIGMFMIPSPNIYTTRFHSHESSNLLIKTSLAIEVVVICPTLVTILEHRTFTSAGPRIIRPLVLQHLVRFTVVYAFIARIYLRSLEYLGAEIDHIVRCCSQRELSSVPVRWARRHLVCG